MAKDTRLIGFNFTKIEAQRNPNYDGKLKIQSGISLDHMEKLKTPKSEVLKVNFSVNIDYGDLGKVNLEGMLHIAAEGKLIKETLSTWEKKQKPTNLQISIVNIILQKSSIKAIQIEEEIGLPVHLQELFPRVKVDSIKESK